MKLLKLLSISFISLLCFPQFAFARNAGFVIRASSDKPIFDSNFSGKNATSKYRFYLPRQAADLTFTVSVYADSPGNSPINPTKVSIEAPAKLTFVSIPDSDLGFEIDYTHMRGLLTDVKNSELTIDDSGCLTGMNAEFKDETATIIADAAISAINIGKAIAKGAMVAGAPKDTYLTPKFTFDVHRLVKLDPIYKVLNKPASSNKNLGGFTLIPDSFKTAGVHFDLEEFGYNINDEIKKAITAKNFAAPDDFNIPKVSVWLNQDLNQATSLQLLQQQKEFVDPTSSKHMKAASAYRYSGLIVRDPNLTEVIVCKKDSLRGEGVIADLTQLIAQTGSFSFVPMHRKFFSDSTTSFKIGTAGAPTDINVKNDSVLWTIFEAVKSVTSAL